MNRRDFLGAMTAASVAGVSAVPELGPRAHEWQIEPRPHRFDFEEACGTMMDVSVIGVAWALERLCWDSADPVKPLLVVHPADYPRALEIAIELNQRIAVWATCFGTDPYAWFVTWRGQRIGSGGA